MSHGLKIRYGMDEEFNSNVRKIIALAFLEPEEISEAFESIVIWMGDEQPVANFIDWFRRNYEAKHVDDTQHSEPIVINAILAGILVRQIVG